MYIMLCMYPGVVPSLAGAANQINVLKKELKLEKVFLASDAPKHGMSFYLARITMHTLYTHPIMGCLINMHTSCREERAAEHGGWFGVAQSYKG